MVDQNTLLEAMQTSAGASNAAKNQENVLTSVLQQLGLLQQDTAGAIDKSVEATNVVEGTALQGQQQAQDDARRYAATVGALGTNPEALLVRLGVDLNAQLEASKSARDNLVAKQGINLIDNPLGWLHAQMTIEADQSALNNSQSAVAGISKDIATATQAVDAFGRTQTALAVKVTDASRVATANARIAEAETVKATALRNHLKDELAIAGTIQNASAAQAQEAQRRLGMLVTQDQLALERQRFEMSKQQFNWEKESKSLALKDKKSQDEVKQMLLAQYNVGAKVTGNPEETNFDLVLARSQLGGTDATRISAIMEAGGNTLAVGSTRVAATPAGAANMIAKRVYGKANDADFAPMKKYLDEQWSLALLANGGKEDKAAISMNASVDDATKRFTKNATATGSFYAPPPIETILGTEAVKQSALYKKVLSAAGKDLKTADPEPIVKLAYEGFKAGVLSIDEAVSGIQTVYAQAAAINNATKKFAAIGIPGQSSFTTNVDVPGMNRAPINLMNYTEIMHSFATKRVHDEATGAGMSKLFGTN